MIIYYMTMMPFYQIRSREQEKSESGFFRITEKGSSETQE